MDGEARKVLEEINEKYTVELRKDILSLVLKFQMNLKVKLNLKAVESQNLKMMRKRLNLGVRQ